MTIIEFLFYFWDKSCHFFDQKKFLDFFFSVNFTIFAIFLFQNQRAAFFYFKNSEKL